MKIPALMALAASLFSASNGHAQAVTLYGVADMSFSYQSRIVRPNGTRPGGSIKAADSGGNTGSRWGVRGREDLGDGFSAHFVLESGVQLDTGLNGQGGRAFGRQSYVGLDGRFGKVTLGRQYTPYFETLSFADSFGNNMVGNSGNLAQANPRLDNAVLYATPTLGGVRAQVMWSPSEDGTTARQVHYAVSYTGAPVWAGATYVRVDGATRGEMGVVGGSYDAKVVTIYASYVKLRNIKPASDATSPAATAAPVLAAGAKGASWHLGAMVPTAYGRVHLSLVQLNDERAEDKDARMLAAGYVYNLSKRTSLYAAAARIRNKNGGVMVVSTPSYGGKGEQQVQLGATHRF